MSEAYLEIIFKKGKEGKGEEGGEEQAWKSCSLVPNNKVHWIIQYDS